MTIHRWCRVGFREVYECDDGWYEERCSLFKYRSVNFVIGNGGEVWIDRRGFRCFRCAFYPLCFKDEIIQRKYGKLLFSGDKDKVKTYLLIEGLNSCDDEDWWVD